MSTTSLFDDQGVANDVQEREIDITPRTNESSSFPTTTKDGNDGTQKKEKSVSPAGGPRKVHHVTVCMVPPPEAHKVWEIVTKMRKQLKDPGYYRWPPHANLLYPFFEFESSKNGADEVLLDELLQKLHAATQQF